MEVAYVKGFTYTMGSKILGSAMVGVYAPDKNVKGNDTMETNIWKLVDSLVIVARNNPIELNVNPTKIMTTIIPNVLAKLISNPIKTPIKTIISP